MSVFRKKIEKRADPGFDDSWYYPGGNFYGGLGIKTSSGMPVDEEIALTYMAVYSCVSLIASDVAKLPVGVFKRLANGDKKKLYNHPLTKVLTVMSNLQTNAFNWKESAQSHVDLWGNHYSQIVRNAAGEVVELVQIPDPDNVVIRLGQDGTITYIWQTGSETNISTQYDMFHLPGYSNNGIIGLSPIQQARETIGLGLAVDEFGAKYFGQGTNLGGVLELSQALGENEADFAKAFNAQYSNLKQSHRVMITRPGQKFTKFGIPAEEAQFLETKKSQKQEVCGIYKVPPHKIGIFDSNANRSNLEQENSSYVDSCLFPRINRFEKHIAAQLLTETERNNGLFVEFNLDGLLRGSAKDRAEIYAKRWGIGSINSNEIRRLENENSIGEDGDKYFVPLNFIPIDDAGLESQDNLNVNTDQEENKNSSDIEQRKLSGIRLRDRIRNRFAPLIRKAAQKLVDKEAKAVRNKIEQRVEVGKFDKWLNDFYTSFTPVVRGTMAPVFREYVKALSPVIKDEIGATDEVDNDVDQFTTDYINTYTKRHISSSRNQLSKIAKEEDNDEKIITRVDEWEETRSDKIEEEESNRLANAIFVVIAFRSGVKVTWTIRGEDTCPYCQQLNNRTIGQGKVFAKKDDSLYVSKDEGGSGAMVFTYNHSHPPLHQGCDCYLRVEKQ